eukprot:CAMPEP_0198219018 /NCGR_PEP_ID=MMETSP1445-20131203/72255_1 /TAXON_ID=36898 /ORGANISM="Pyramimonas sp., Strain CCMP2087" /LENGTH=124 /DNA_ID=CAMNT_0043896303 /DNA_START=86 /DNA_END=460 /DNA_ORIENTATION=+
MASFAMTQSASAFAGRVQFAAPVKQTTSRAAMPAVAGKLAKAADFRGLSPEEIDKEVYTCKRALFDLRLKKAIRQDYKSSEFKVNKKKVAVLLTIKREKEIAEGITMRESRKMNKKASVRANAF